MGAYFVALLGRVVGSRLARKVRPEKLLVGAVILSAAGFLPFWLAPLGSPVLPTATLTSVADLFVAGLGIGDLYPVSASLATGAPGRGPCHLPDRAHRRLRDPPLPPALGIVAGRSSIGGAYAIVAALLFATATLTVAVDRSARKQ